MLQITKMRALLGSQLGSQKSHPNKLLIDHLEKVAVLATELSENKGLVIEQELLQIIALTHDLGKVHPKFQSLLDGKGKGVVHAKPSAWFTYSLTGDIWAAEIVSRHHTHLRNLADMKADWKNDNSFKKTMDDLLPDWPFPVTEDQFKKLQLFLFLTLEKSMTISDWLRIRTLYSLLIAADRMEAIGIGSLPEKQVPIFTEPDLPSRSEIIDAWRKENKEICIASALEINEPGVYTLTLPTGAGKTLIGLKIAHQWAKKFGCNSIIYGLPFISIVEQTASVAKDVFGAGNIQEDHSLIQERESDEQSEYIGEQAYWKKMISLFRYWQAPVVLTTLVHFWDAIYNPSANKTMNFHQLSNSVIILDEPQSISPRYWKGFGQTLAFLSKEFNVFFILMTATQPHLGSNKELAPREILFPYSRHQFEIVAEKTIKINELTALLLEKLSVREYSGLVVLNRKKAALQVYYEMEKLGIEAPLLLLSGWMTPLRRRIILRYIKWLEQKKKKRYLVSTQAVEAGVDLDFGWVFRDMGPLDSIIQVAGRCNRHAKEGFVGKILVAEMTNDRGQSLWKHVYDDIPIEKTKEVLSMNPNFTEQDVKTIVEQYYRKVLEGLQSTPIYDDLANGKWGQYAKLIEKNDEEYQTITVFIEENRRLLPMLKKLEETEWALENRHEQKKLTQKIMQYSIQIPKKLIVECQSFCSRFYTDDDDPIFKPLFDGDVWLLKKEAIKKEGGLYSPIVGFIPPDSSGDSANKL